MYTGASCFQDLRLTQRRGDLRKWKYFDVCLASALDKLKHDPDPKAQLKEVKKLYSGMANVKYDFKNMGQNRMWIIIKTTFHGIVWSEFLYSDEDKKNPKIPAKHWLDTFTSFYNFASVSGCILELDMGSLSRFVRCKNTHCLTFHVHKITRFCNIKA